MKLYIFGPQGTGKTTVSKYLSSKYMIPHFSGSEIMMKICNATDRQELKNMDVEYKRKMEDRYYIPFLENHENIIVDGHGSLNNDQVKFFDKYIYLICAPDLLLERRYNDASRSDRELDVDSIKSDFLQYMKKCDVLEQQGVNVQIVDNSDSLEQTITSIENIIENKEQTVEQEFQIKTLC